MAHVEVARKRYILVFICIVSLFDVFVLHILADNVMLCYILGDVIFYSDFCQIASCICSFRSV